MDLRNKLKSNMVIRRIGKKINIYMSYNKEARDFSQNFIEEAIKKGDYKYSIMLLVHSLEKGMCMPTPRPYGFDKVNELMKYLKIIEKSEMDSFEYKLGLSILSAWMEFFENNNWTNFEEYYEVKKYLKNKLLLAEKSGHRNYERPNSNLSEQYYDIISSRHSVRDFMPDILNEEDIKFAIRCFIETPTACNRQMCGLIYVENSEIKKLLDGLIIGLPGFNKENTQYFVITYDLAAFAYAGERNQGLFNAGLCTTNFINGLHSRGIGSCCLQWSNKYREDQKVRSALHMSKSERIAVVIGCGYYKEKTVIPCSVRKTEREIYRKI